MDRKKHKIIVCTSCGQNDTGNVSGVTMISQLCDALDASNFEISRVESMAGCVRPFTVPYQETATHMLGDIIPETDIPDLIALAAQSKSLDERWCSSTTRPSKLRFSTFAYVPAMLSPPSSEVVQ